MRRYTTARSKLPYRLNRWRECTEWTRLVPYNPPTHKESVSGPYPAEKRVP